MFYLRSSDLFSYVKICFEVYVLSSTVVTYFPTLKSVLKYMFYRHSSDLFSYVKICFDF